MRQKRRLDNGTEHKGNIGDVRSVEDCIRATHKYTEGVRTMRAKHPIQGEEFPNKVVNKIYEVYPDTELSWEMPAGEAIDWLWGDVPCIDVLFRYDYRVNRASVEIRDGAKAIQELARAIPGFEDALAAVKNSWNDEGGK